MVLFAQDSEARSGSGNTKCQICQSDNVDLFNSSNQCEHAPTWCLQCIRQSAEKQGLKSMVMCNQNISSSDKKCNKTVCKSLQQLYMTDDEIGFVVEAAPEQCGDKVQSMSSCLEPDYPPQDSRLPIMNESRISILERLSKRGKTYSMVVFAKDSEARSLNTKCQICYSDDVDLFNSNNQCEHAPTWCLQCIRQSAEKQRLKPTVMCNQIIPSSSESGLKESKCDKEVSKLFLQLYMTDEEIKFMEETAEKNPQSSDTFTCRGLKLEQNEDFKQQQYSNYPKTVSICNNLISISKSYLAPNCHVYCRDCRTKYCTNPACYFAMMEDPTSVLDPHNHNKKVKRHEHSGRTCEQFLKLKMSQIRRQRIDDKLYERNLNYQYCPSCNQGIYKYDWIEDIYEKDADWSIDNTSNNNTNGASGKKTMSLSHTCQHVKCGGTENGAAGSINGRGCGTSLCYDCGMPWTPINLMGSHLHCFECKWYNVKPCYHEECKNERMNQQHQQLLVQPHENLSNYDKFLLEYQGRPDKETGFVVCKKYGHITCYACGVAKEDLDSKNKDHLSTCLEMECEEYDLLAPNGKRKHSTPASVIDYHFRMSNPEEDMPNPEEDLQDINKDDDDVDLNDISLKLSDMTMSNSTGPTTASDEIPPVLAQRYLSRRQKTKRLSLNTSTNTTSTNTTSTNTVTTSTTTSSSK